MAFLFVTEKAPRPVPLKSQRCGSGSLAFWRTSGSPLPPSSVSCFVATNGTSHPVSLIRNPEGPFASLWPAPYKADHLSHPPVLSPKYVFLFFGEKIPLHSLPGTHCVEQVSFEFVRLSLLLSWRPEIIGGTILPDLKSSLICLLPDSVPSSLSPGQHFLLMTDMSASPAWPLS